MTPIDIWQEFLEHNPEYQDIKYDVWYFGHTEEDADKLLKLVIKKKKTATTTSYLNLFYDCEEIPKINDISIITDFNGKAKAIIKTVDIQIINYNQMTEKLAQKEGEGNLIEWKEIHEKFYKRELQFINIEFDESIPLVYEEFELIYGEKI